MKKRSKIMAAAIAIIGFSTVASVTGTVAWFSASNVVNVGGMSIQAETEQGIVMAAEEASHTAASWSTDVTATHTGAGATFIPASSNDMTNWYHGISQKVDNGQDHVVYEAFTVSTTNLVYNGSGVATGTTTSQVQSAKNIYLYNEFYVQMSSGDAKASQDLYIKDLAVSGSSVSVELNKAIRIAFKYDTSAVKIYNGIVETGAEAVNTTSYNVNGSIATTSYLASTTTDVNTSEIAENVTIPAYIADGSTAKVLKVYVWFEGEDAHLKSSNITATLDRLTVSFKLGNKEHDA